MFDSKVMLLHEISYCQEFTDTVVTKYGKIHHNPLNKLSWDSNHAYIFDFADPERAIRDITQFYQSQDIKSRIYSSFIDNELEVLKPFLESQGFTLTIDASEFMLYEPQPIRTIAPSISIQRITQISEDIIELIHTEEAGDWTINVLKTSISDSRFHLLGLYHEAKCKSIASIRIMDGYSRIDDVKTHKVFRGQHFGTQLIRYLAGYHRRISKNYLYLWTDNPIAIRLYQNSGFQKIVVKNPCWMAVLDK